MTNNEQLLAQIATLSSQLECLRDKLHALPTVEQYHPAIGVLVANVNGKRVAFRQCGSQHLEYADSYRDFIRCTRSSTRR